MEDALDARLRAFGSAAISGRKRWSYPPSGRSARQFIRSHEPLRDRHGCRQCVPRQGNVSWICLFEDPICARNAQSMQEHRQVTAFDRRICGSTGLGFGVIRDAKAGRFDHWNIIGAIADRYGAAG